MDVSLIAPENKLFPGRKRWTRKECAKLEPLGVLPERYELIDGQVISKMGTNPPHNVTLNRQVKWLVFLFGIDFLRNQQSITLRGQAGKVNEPQPDIAITVGPNETYATRDPAPFELVLLIEVSDTTLRMDKNTQALLYAKVGVREYWVANIAKREIIRHRNPKRTGYAQVVTLGTEERILPEGRPEGSIRVGDLFPARARKTGMKRKQAAFAPVV